MDRRVTLALLLALGLGGLQALAAASPPDPAWQPGVYDEADHDDVVQAALSLEGSRDDSPATGGRVEAVVLLAARPVPPAPFSASRPLPDSRAPPAF